MHKDPIHSLFIGSKQLELPSCHSTNALASDLLAENRAVEGMVILTPMQTAGRGQRGNQWESQPYKNLTFSVILKPTFIPITLQFDLTVLSSLAIADCLIELGLSKAKIKWPNDIFCKGSKIAGILIENIVRSDKMEWAIIGIGLNVNQVEFKTPGATSISLELNHDITPEKVLSVLLRKLNENYSILKSGGREELRKSYLKRLLWKEEKREFRNTANNVFFTGVIKNVTNEGKLIIETENQQRSFDFKEVAFRF